MSELHPIYEDPRFRLTTAAAGQTVFSVPFFFQANADITVIRIDGVTSVETVLEEGVHYTLTGAMVDGGGTVTLLQPAVSGDQYLRLGRAPRSRVTAVTRNGQFRSAAFDDEFDRAAIFAQEIDREFDRTFKVPYGQTPPDLIIGDDNHLLMWVDGQIAEGPLWTDLTGIPGPALPAGGTTWQVPVKLSGTSYDIGWATLPLERVSYAGVATLTEPVDADELLLLQAATTQPKRFSFTNLVTWIREKLGAIIAGATSKTTPVDADSLALADSAASNATKRLTIGNLKPALKPYFDTLYPISVQAATQAQQETATSSSVAVTPAVQQFHPSALKAWLYATVSAGTPTVQASYNVTSIVDTGAGQLTVNIGTDFSSANWAPLLSASQPGETQSLYFSSISAGSILLANNKNSVGVYDPVAWSFMAAGDQ